MLGQKSCRTKVSRNFRIFVPNFAPNFAPNFPRNFRGLFVLRFVGDGGQKKSTKNPRHFSMQNSQVNTTKIFTKFFWRAGNVKMWVRHLLGMEVRHRSCWWGDVARHNCYTCKVPKKTRKGVATRVARQVSRDRGYHSPRKHYLPEKIIFELFSDYRFTISISSN